MKNQSSLLRLFFLSMIGLILWGISILPCFSQATRAIVVDINSGNPVFPFPQFLYYESSGLSLGNLATQNAQGVSHAEMEQKIRDAYHIMMNRADYTTEKVDGISFIYFNSSPSCTEGDGYALLAAAYMADKTTFDGLWMWVHEHRLHGSKNDPIKSYINGSNLPTSTYSYCPGWTSNGADCAADGDYDIGLALLVAAMQWGEHSGVMTATGEINYVDEARRFINGMVQKEEGNVTGDNKWVSGNIGFDGYVKGGDTWAELTAWASGQNPGPQFSGPTDQHIDYFAPAYFNEFGIFLQNLSQPAWNILQLQRAEASSDWIMGKIPEMSATKIPVAGWVTKTGGDASAPVIKNFMDGEDFRAPWRTILNYVWHGNPSYSWNPVSHQVQPGVSNTYEYNCALRMAGFLKNPQAAPWNNACSKFGGGPALTYWGPATLRQYYSTDGVEGTSFTLNWLQGTGSISAVAAQDYNLMAQMYRQCVIEWDAESIGYLQSKPKYFHGWFRLLGMLTLSGNLQAPAKMTPKANMKIYRSVDKTYAFTGDQITYTFDYRNYGSIDAQNVTIVEHVPADFQFVSATNGGTYNASQHTVTWNIALVKGFVTGQLANTKGQVSYIAKVKDNASGRYCTTADISCNNGTGWTTNEYPNHITAVMERNCVDVVKRALLIKKSADKKVASPGDTVLFTIEFENSSDAGWLDGGRPGVNVSYAHDGIANPSAAAQSWMKIRLFHDAAEPYIDYGNYRISYFLFDPVYTCYVGNAGCPTGWNLSNTIYEGGNAGGVVVSHENIVEGNDASGKWNQRLIVQFAPLMVTTTPHLSNYYGMALRIHEGGTEPLRAVWRHFTSNYLNVNWADDWSWDSKAKDTDGGLYYPVSPNWEDPYNPGFPVTSWHDHACQTASTVVEKVLVEEWDGYVWRRILGNGPVPGRDVKNVFVCDTLPAGVSFISFTGTPPLGIQPVFNNKIISWNISKLQVNQKGKIQFLAVVDFPSGAHCPAPDELIVNKSWIYGEHESPVSDTATVLITCNDTGCTPILSALLIPSGHHDLCQPDSLTIAVQSNPSTQVQYEFFSSNGISLKGPSASASFTIHQSGSYYAVVSDPSDPNVCYKISDTITVVIHIPPSGYTETEPSSCGQADGSATVFPSGGSAPYHYLWNDISHQTGQKAVNLSSGLYIVTITDAFGCTTIDSAVVQDSGGITAQLNVISHATCFQICDGEASVQGIGGTIPYKYIWSNGDTEATIDMLCAGLFTVTTTDFKGCTSVDSVIITEPLALTGIISSTDVLCSGDCTGNLTISPAGGTPGYQYVWNTGYTDQQISDVCAGDFSVTVSDNNGCTLVMADSVTEPPEILVTIQTTDSECKQATGSATANATGGSTPYHYLWNDISHQTGQKAENLSSGLYIVTVTDASGCSVVDSAVVNDSGGITAQLNVISQATCFQICDGEAGVQGIGGTIPYNYIWSNGDTDATIDMLCAGLFTVTTTDAKGCISVGSVIITEPPALTEIISSTDVLCYGDCTGSLTISPAGGTPGYQYVWNTGHTGQQVSDVCAGDFSVTISDANGCTLVMADSVTEPSEILVTIQTTDSECKQATGSATANATGGTPGYHYLWNNGYTDATITGLQAGTYSVTISDSKGCDQTAIAVVSDAGAPEISMLKTDVACSGDCNGLASVNITGGVSPYVIHWSNNETTETISGLCANTYTITVTATDGCIATGSAIISQPPVLSITIIPGDTICIGETTPINSYITGGMPAYKYLWNTGETSTVIQINPVQTTTCSLTITDANGCTAYKSCVQEVFPPLEIELSTERDTLCAGECTDIVIAGNGGMGDPYTFLLSDGTLIPSPYTVCPKAQTTYTIFMKDNCTTPPVFSEITIVVTDTVPVFFHSNTTKGCAPLTVYFNEIGGANGKTYTWNFGDGSGDISFSDKNAVHTFTFPGNYGVSLKLISAAGCENSLTMQNLIHVYPIPFAGFTAKPEVTSILDPVIQFENNSDDVTNVLWDFGDGFVAEQIHPLHHYDNPGAYWVSLEIETIHGCKDSVGMQILIQDILTFYAPDAFFPDHDGMNDLFSPIGYGIDPDHYFFAVYDRWGARIFETHIYGVDENGRIVHGWDGTIRGNEEAMTGTYVWLCVFKNITGIEYSKSGQVTLLK